MVSKIQLMKVLIVIITYSSSRHLKLDDLSFKTDRYSEGHFFMIIERLEYADKIASANPSTTCNK